MNSAQELMGRIRSLQGAEDPKNIFHVLRQLIASAPRNFRDAVGLDGESFYSTRGERKQLARAKAAIKIAQQRETGVAAKYLHRSARLRLAASAS